MGSIFPAALMDLVIRQSTNQLPLGVGSGGRSVGVSTKGGGGGMVISNRGGVGWSGVISGTGGGARVWVQYGMHLPELYLWDRENSRTLL